MQHHPAWSCLSLVLALGCRATPAVEPEPTGQQPAVQQPELDAVAPTAALEPACTVTRSADGQLTVGGRPLPTQTLLDPNVTAELRIRSFPYRADAILLALGTDYPWWPGAEAYPSNTLWELPCDRPEELRVFATIELADFAWAEMEPDGSALYFSYGAVHRLDLATRQYAPVTTPPGIADCWMREDEPPISATEYVVGWVGDDRLLIQWGGWCGFEAEWNGGTAIIENPRGTANRRASAHVGSIAEANGSVWVGNGGSCAEPTGMWDGSTPGVWRSDDVGESWTFLPIPALAKIGRGVEAITTTDGRVSVQAGCCYVGAYDECESQRLHSDDGGRTWTLDHGQPNLAPGPRSVVIGEWVLEGTADGVTKRRADEPSGAGKTVLLPGLE